MSALRATCEKLLAEVRHNVEEIKRQAVFDDAQQRRAVLEVHEEGVRLLEQRLAEAQ